MPLVTPSSQAMVVETATAILPAADAGHDPDAMKTVAAGSVAFIDGVTFETGFTFADTEVGGLSELAYAAESEVTYALSDDRSQAGPARFYTVDIGLVDGRLVVEFLEVTELRDAAGNLFDRGAIDPEGLALIDGGLLAISTEGDANIGRPTDPFIGRFALAGDLQSLLLLPDHFLYSVPGNHVRNNLGFEALTISPDGRTLYAAVENALAGDGPLATLVDGSPARVIEFDLNTGRPGREFVYCLEPIPTDSNPAGGDADNGLVALQTLDNNGTFLALERAYAGGVGNTVRLFETTIRGAADVSGAATLALDGCPPAGLDVMDKRLLADLEADLGVVPDNVEGMTLGPVLADGRTSLFLVSDNNFNPDQATQFLALALGLRNNAN